MSRGIVIIAAALASLAASAFAQGGADLIVRARRVYVGDGRVLDDAAIVVVGGKIAAVGAAPADAGAKEVFAFENLHATPGFVEGSSHVGLPRGRSENEESSETTPELDVRAGLDPADEEFARLLDLGVTTVVVTPGTRNVFGGYSAAMKPKAKGPPRTLKAPVASQAVTDRHPTAGNSPPGRGFFRSGGPDIFSRRPNTRMGVVHELRRGLSEGKGVASGAGWTRLYATEKGDALARSVRGEVPFAFVAPNATDALAAIRVADEFGVKAFYLQDAGEAHLVADKLAERKIGVLVGAIDARFRAEEEGARAGVMTAPKLLEDKGVLFGFSRGTGDEVSSLRASMTFAARGGLAPGKAVAAVTGRPATIVGIADSVGSIEPGKDADILLFDGDPLAPSSKLIAVISDGVVVRRSEPRK